MTGERLTHRGWKIIRGGLDRSQIRPRPPNRENPDRLLWWGVAESNIWAVDQAIADGADVRQVFPGRPPLLIIAAVQGDLAILTRLLENGADPDAADEEGRTALSWAVELEWEPVVRRLLRYGADPNREDREGWSPLMWAVGQGNLSLVNLLLDAGADPHYINPISRETALTLAESRGEKEIAGRLKRAMLRPAPVRREIPERRR